MTNEPSYDKELLDYNFLFMEPLAEIIENLPARSHKGLCLLIINLKHEYWSNTP